MIRGVTFDEQEIKAKDLAHMMRILFGGRNGRTNGVTISQTISSITVGPGIIFVKGRMISIESNEFVTIPSANGKTYLCMLVCEIDLGKINTETSFTQASIKVLTNEVVEGFPPSYPIPLTQDLEAGGTVYQLQMAVFQLDATGISGFDTTIYTITENQFA